MNVETLRHEEKRREVGLLVRGLSEWERGEESRISGERVPHAAATILSMALTREDWFVRILSLGPGGVVGFVIERSSPDGWIEGLVFWLDPSSRGRFLPEDYFKQLRGIARESSSRGVRFLSTLPLWRKLAPRCGFNLVNELPQGGEAPPVLCWELEV